MLKDPLKSLRAKHNRIHERFGDKVWRGGKKGVHGALPGEVRNPTGKGGFGDNPSPERLLARRRGQFKPGIVTNPYGRAGSKSVGIEKPRTHKRTIEQEAMVLEAREAAQLARQSMRKAIERVAQILDDENASDMAAIAAFHALSDRAYGKPTQTNVNANLDMDKKTSELTGNELERRIAEALQGVERVTKRKRETLISEDGPTNLRELN